MNCSHCGQNLAPSAKFCNGCGKAQSPAPATVTDSAPAVLVCAQCQAECKPGAKFCLACGHKLGAPLPSTEAPTPPAAPSGPDCVYPIHPKDTPRTDTVPPVAPPPPVVDLPAPGASDSGAALPSPQPPPVAPPVSPPVSQGTDRIADPIDPPIAPPTTSTPPYTRWAVAAVGVVLVAGLAWMALKPSAAPQAETAATTDSSTPAQVQDGSHDDRAKAESLVGPASQGGLVPAVRTPDIAPASPDPIAAVPAAAPVVAPAAVAPAAPVASARPAEPSKPAASKPAPAPAKPAPQKAKPSLNDLLD